MRTKLNRLIFSLFFIGSSLLSFSAVIYVDKDATGSDNGSDWTNAYTDLQDGLLAASIGDEIWVATGSYKPTNSNNRSLFFNIPSGVKLYGGFEGIETIRSERDWDTNPTALSGNIGFNSITTDNTKLLLVVSGTSNLVLIDGFVIKDAYNESDANFTFLSSDNLKFKHCIFRDNTSLGTNQFYTTNSEIELRDCLLYDNSSSGNLWEVSTGSELTLFNTTWTENTADIVLYSTTPGGITANNCIGWNNVETSNNNLGEANNCILENGSGEVISFTNIIDDDPLFTNPAADDFTLHELSPAIGFGDNDYVPLGLDLAYNLRVSGVNVDLGCYEKRVPEVILVDIDASGLNLGITWEHAFNKIEDALLIAIPGDKLWVAEGIYKAENPNSPTEQFIIPDGVDLIGGFSGTETNMNQANPHLNQTRLSADIGIMGYSLDNADRIMYLLNSVIGVKIKGFVFEAIDGEEAAVSIISTGSNISNVSIENCIFRNNKSTLGGSSIQCETEGSAETITKIENCLFYENNTISVIDCFTGIHTMDIIGCTFSENVYLLPQTPTIIGGDDSDVGIYNSIFWGNGFNDSYVVYGTSEIQNCIDENGTTSGTIVNEDPLFVDPIGLDFSLEEGSPAVGFGNNLFVTSNKDLGNDNRIQSINVDLGAYESTYVVFGCLDSTACNYDPNAEVNNGTCQLSGCMDSNADNYDSNAFCDNGSCDYNIITLYVDIDANGANNGSSWANAFNSIQDAIDAASIYDQIWIAEGTYHPHASDRLVAIELKDGVGLYGGFQGTESLLTQRNWSENVTKISGEIGGSALNDNSLFLLKASGHEETIILNGLTLCDQYANIDLGDIYDCAALYFTECNIDIQYCRFTNNKSFQTGAISSNGIADGEGLVDHCLFDNCIAETGAIIWCDPHYELIISNSTIADIAYVGDVSSTLFRSGISPEVVIYNCIFNNIGALEMGMTSMVISCDHVILDKAYSTIDAENQVMIEDPLFMGASIQDYSLSANSPAINSGASVPFTADLDLAHNERILDGVIDMGAYEFDSGSNGLCEGDANGDGLVNAVDYLAISSFFGCTSGCTTGDANGDGAVNAVDYLSVSSFFGIPCP